MLIVKLNLSAQILSSCSEKLLEAEKAFQEGHLNIINDLLGQCVDDDLDDDEVVRALKLLTIVNLYLDKYEDADRYYLVLLKKNPEFEPNNLVDPSELLFLHENFKTDPKFSFRMFRLGINYSNVLLIKPYTLSNYYGNTISEYSGSQNLTESNVGLEISFGYEYHVNKFISQITDIQFRGTGFQRKINIFNISHLNFNENNFYIDIPFLIKAALNHKTNLNTYFILGTSCNILFESKALNLTRIISKRSLDVDNEIYSETYEEISGANIDLLNKRKKLGFSTIAGFGLSKKMGLNNLSLEIRYQHSLTKANDPNSRFNNDDPLFFNYWYIDDDFKLDNFNLSISYVKPLFIPRKIK